MFPSSAEASMIPSASRMGRKRDQGSIDTAVIDICRREIGHLSTRNFVNRLAASEDLVRRLGLLRKLEIHRGRVNTVSFNEGGDILLSAGNDRRIIMWDWENGRVHTSFNSGHNETIFQAKIMPGTDDRRIVSCAANGQVRHAMISEYGKIESKLLGNHQNGAYNLANELGSPHIFYTCGGDDLVQRFDLRTGVATKLFNMYSTVNPITLFSIAIDPRNPNLFAVAGSDQYTRLFNIRKYKWNGSDLLGKPINYFCPPHLISDRDVTVTGLAYSDQSELLASYASSSIYLFSKDMGLGEDLMATMRSARSSNSKMETGMQREGKVGPRVYKEDMNYCSEKGVGFLGPKCEYVVSGSDCGQVFIWRKGDTELVRTLGKGKEDDQIVHCIGPHPYMTLLASSGFGGAIKIWTPASLERAFESRRFRFFPILPRVLKTRTQEEGSEQFDS